MSKSHDWKELVKHLKKVSETKKISGYKLAQETGYSESTISRIFSQKFCPQLKIFLDIAKVLEVDITLDSHKV